MKNIILTAVVMLVLLTGGLFLYISSGSYDISQLTPHNSLTKWMINTTKHKSIDKRMEGIEVPSNLTDTDMLALGFEHYDEMCVSCHGAPGEEPDELAKGLYPKPPKIYKRDGEDPREFFWIIKNGIKMTSMPAYGPTHDDAKIWAITAFVTKKLPKMNEDEYHAWKTKYADEEEDEDNAMKDSHQERQK